MKKISAFIIGLGIMGCISGVQAQETAVQPPFNESIWRIEHLKDQKTLIDHYQNDQKFVYISFNPYTHKIRGSGLCNKFLGTFQNNGNQLNVSKVESQKNICLDTRVNQQDERFFDYLRQVRSYSVSGKVLHLKDDQGKVLITAKYFR